MDNKDKGNTTGFDPADNDEISEINFEDIDASKTQFEEKRYQATTKRTLGYVLVGILAISFFVHYILLFKAYSINIELVNILEKAFNIWLPVIASLTSSVITYYFTKK